MDVPYVMPGGDQPYKFTFSAKVFNSGKIVSIKSGSEKDEISVKLADGNRQAEVRRHFTVNFLFYIFLHMSGTNMDACGLDLKRIANGAL